MKHRPGLASKLRLTIIFVTLGLIIGPRLAVGAIILGQIDDFQTGTTQNWNGARQALSIFQRVDRPEAATDS